MDVSALHLAAYGLLFILGLGLALRPGVIFMSLIFKPVFLAMVLMLGAGALALAPSGASQNLPVLASGGAVSALGAFAGFKLRRLKRGGL